MGVKDGTNCLERDAQKILTPGAFLIQFLRNFCWALKPAVMQRSMGSTF
jgi:hypothetical protein